MHRGAQPLFILPAPVRPVSVMLQGAASQCGYAPASPVVLTFLLAPLHPYWHPTKQGRWVTFQMRLPMLCSHSQLQDRRSINTAKT